jgi:hypothetical protein
VSMAASVTLITDGCAEVVRKNLWPVIVRGDHHILNILRECNYTQLQDRYTQIHYSVMLKCVYCVEAY